MKNFQSTVPEKIQEKLLNFSENVELYDIAKTYDKERIEEISGHSYDGFISLNRGGFEISAFADCGYGSGSYVTKEQEKFIDQLRDQVEQDFREENNIIKDQELTDEQWNEFCEFECNNEYFEPLLIRVEIWVKDNIDEIFFRLSIGYKDAPYYRSNYDETLNEFTITFDEFLNTDNDKIVKKLLKY